MKPPAKWNQDRGYIFYTIAALGAVAVAVIGFHLTYTLPMSRGAFPGPKWSHVHGALLFGWLVLLVIQVRLATRRTALHRKLGWSASVIAPFIVMSTIAIGHEAATIGLARGDGPIAYSGFLGSVTAPIIFLCLVAAAIAMRSKPQWHKRLIFVATVSMLWPAWFRWRHFLPALPRPEITLSLILADLPIVIAMIRDRLRFGAVHPAYLYAGLGLIAEQTFETFAFDTPAWRRIATTLYGLAV